MTRNDFYKAVAEGNLTTEVQEYAQKIIDGEAAKAAERETTRAAILGAVSLEPMTAQELAAVLGVTWQKVSTTLTNIYKTGESNLVKGQNAAGKRTWAVAKEIVE